MICANTKIRPYQIESMRQPRIAARQWVDNVEVGPWTLGLRSGSHIKWPGIGLSVEQAVVGVVKWL